MVAEGGCTRRVSLAKLRLQSLIYENKNIREDLRQEYSRRIYSKNLQEITGKEQKTKRKILTLGQHQRQTYNKFERKTDINRRVKTFTSRYIKI